MNDNNAKVGNLATKLIQTWLISDFTLHNTC